MVKKKSKKKINKNLPLLVSGIVSVLVIAFSVPFLLKDARGANLPFLTFPTPTPDPVRIREEVSSEILPPKADLDISFGDSVTRMVREGAIDEAKFKDIYGNNPELKAQAQKYLDSASSEKIVMTNANAGLILNLLWPLGISNKTAVLSDSPMGTTYGNDVGNFASTGGWTLGKVGGGKLFNSLALIPLTKDQESEVKDIAQNIFRPCCGNSTYFPDCNHGAAMLAFIELAVTQGMPVNDIYKKALILNSYWFPQTYADLDIYFKIKKGINWDKVDPKTVLSQNYSSGQGAANIDKELQTEGLVPKVSGGQSC